MKLKNGKYYQVLKEGAWLERYATDASGKVVYLRVDLHPGMKIKYVGEDYDAVDYDVVPLPYFDVEGKHYAFQPSSFSGLIPPGWISAEPAE